MKIKRKNEINEVKNNEFCIIHEYLLDDKDINCVVSEIRGRYPEKGFVVNEVCKELVYIMNGEGIIGLVGGETKLQTGDMIILEPGEKLYWDGNMTMIVSCTPAWFPEQHKDVN